MRPKVPIPLDAERKRHKEQVIAELEEIAARHGFDLYELVDSAFGSDMLRLHCQTMKKNDT